MLFRSYRSFNSSNFLLASFTEYIFQRRSASQNKTAAAAHNGSPPVPLCAINAHITPIPNQHTRKNKTNGFRYCFANSQPVINFSSTKVAARPSVLVHHDTVNAATFVFRAEMATHIAALHTVGAGDLPDAEPMQVTAIPLALNV